MTEIKAIMRKRVGSFTDFFNANKIYQLGEETYIMAGEHAGQHKVGDGITPWNDLEYAPRTASNNANGWGLVKGSNIALYGFVNPDGTITINTLATRLSALDDSAAALET